MLTIRNMRDRAPGAAAAAILAFVLTAAPVTVSALGASAVSAADTLDSRPPVVGIDHPGDGDIFVGASAETLQWTIDEQSWNGVTTPVTLRLLDGVSLLDEVSILPAPGGVYEYVWTVTDLTTTQGRMVVSATDRFGWTDQDSSGTFTILESNTSIPVLMADRLGPVVPNPFNPSTRIHFSLKADATIELSVYDMRGRTISRLASGAWPAGGHNIQWQGRDDTGAAVSSGAYFARLSINDGDVMVTRLTLVR